MRFSILFLVFLIFISSCKKKENKQTQLNTTDTTQTKVLVLCEGNFMWGNASLDVYYPQDRKVVNDVYKKQNAGKPLGDVLQSGVIANGNIWLVLNNSGKIVSIDRNSFIYQNEIGGFKSPRYMAQSGNDFWVTDIYDNHLSIASANGSAANKKVKLKGWSEQILEVNGELIVANERGFVFIFDPSTKEIKDSILLKKGSEWMVLDKNKKLWVLASDSSKSFLFRIDLDQKKVEKQYNFGLGIAAHKIAISKNQDTIFYLSEGVYAMSIVSPSLPAVPILSQGLSNFYGIGVDPFNGEVYVANAKDYVSKGEVLVISSAGKELRRFASGIIPSAFLFYK